MKKRLYPYLVLSLLLHLLAIFFFRIPRLPSLAPWAMEEPIWVDLKKGEYEIADILPPLKEERPKEAKFLGMYDSQTTKETVAPTSLPQKEKLKPQKKKVSEGGNWAMVEEKRIVPPALLEDYHPDFHHGRHTYLNVLRFPDVQYFVRLKRVFKMTFNPLSPLSEAYFQNRITQGKIETVLAVSLDQAGNLAELFVLRGSGIAEFDEETLRTIRASAPFSTPPAKFLDPDGMLRMSWTFTVYL